MDKIELTPELKAAFDSYGLDCNALDAKYSHFLAAIHREQKALVVKARDLWAEVREVMKLPPSVDYQYHRDGYLYPVPSPVLSQPGELGLGPVQYTQEMPTEAL